MTSATKNSFWYLCFNLSRLFVLFFGNMWVSRILGPENFGEFSFLLSIIIYISSIDALCHESVVKQFLADKLDTGLILGTASFLNMILAVAVMVTIITFGSITINNSLYLSAFLLFIPGQFSKPLNPIAHLFDVRLLAKYSSLALFIAAVVSMAIRAISVNYTENLNYQTFGYAVQALVYGAILYWFYRRYGERVKWDVSLKLLLTIVRRSFPIFISSVLFLSLSQSDMLMITHILGFRDVGLYSIVVKLSDPWVIVSSALCTSYFALIFNPAINFKKQSKYFVRANQFSIYFVVILGLFLCLFIKPIVAVLLGPDYSGVSSVFRIYFWSILFLFFANIQHIWELYYGKYSISLYKTASAVLLKIGLNFLLGSYFGLNGFAMATVLSLFFYGMGFNFFSQTTGEYLRLQLRAFKLSEGKFFYRLFRMKGKQWLRKGF